MLQNYSVSFKHLVPAKSATSPSLFRRWRSLFSAFGATESVIESRSRAQEQESGRKVGRESDSAAPAGRRPSHTFRCGAVLMYETDERVQQQRLARRDLIAPRGADSQSGVMVNTRQR